MERIRAEGLYRIEELQGAFHQQFHRFHEGAAQLPAAGRTVGISPAAPGSRSRPHPGQKDQGRATFPFRLLHAGFDLHRGHRPALVEDLQSGLRYFERFSPQGRPGKLDQDLAREEEYRPRGGVCAHALAICGLSHAAPLCGRQERAAGAQGSRHAGRRLRWTGQPLHRAAVHQAHHPHQRDLCGDWFPQVLRPYLCFDQRRPDACHGGAQHPHDQHALPPQPLRHGQYDRGDADRSLLRLCAFDQRNLQRGEARS